MLINILLETNIFFNIHVLRIIFFVNDYAIYSIWEHLVSSCALLQILNQFDYFSDEHNLMHPSDLFLNFKPLIFSHTIEAAFIIMIFYYIIQCLSCKLFPLIMSC